MSLSAAAVALRERLRAAPLETSRLTLRLPRTHDATAIFDGYAADPDTIRWMDFRPHTTVTTVETVVADWCGAWDRGDGFAFVVQDRATAQFFGVVHLSVGQHGAKLGYVFGRHAWGRGIATEAALCIVDVAFTQFGVWRVWATCAPQNSASRRVLEKVGMRHEGVLRRWIVSPLVSPEPRDSDCLAITRDDWLACRPRGLP